MFIKKPVSIRQQLIIECLQNHQKVTITELMNYVNDRIGEQSTSITSKQEYKKSTFEKTIHAIRNDLGVEIDHIKEGKTHYYRLKNPFNTPFLNSEEKEGMGFLLSLIKIYDQLPSVQWLKETLDKEFQIDPNYYIKNEHFVMVHPIINNHEKLLKLAQEIIGYIERQELIFFTYKKVNTDTTNAFKEVAPLQVRFYEGRYYLLGCETYHSKTDEEENILRFKSQFSIYAMDQIEDYFVTPALDDNTFQALNFDYTELFNQTKLGTIFEDSMGIFVENKPAQKIRIRFTDWAKSYVLNKKIHHSQRIIKDEHNEVIIEIYVRPGVELDFQLSRFREYYEILS